MDVTRTLVGRERLWAELNRLLSATTNSRGGLVLLVGEAGVGKTRLATEAVNASRLLVLGVPPTPSTSLAYGPIVGALRAFHRLGIGELPLASPLGAYLRVLLPEFGDPPDAADRATIFEAVRSAFETIGRGQPTVVFLDDLHDADHATLELLPYLASSLEEQPVLLLGAYRGEQLARDHPLRAMRVALRRAGRLRELTLELLDATESATLAAHVLGRPPSPALAALVYARTEGLPLFVEELSTMLSSGGRLRETDGALGLADESALLPVPDTVRDLVLHRAARLGDAARSALDVAAVAGTTFDLDLVADLAGGEAGFDEPFAHGLLVETAPGTAAFRHPLIRDALYSDISWTRRRELHRQLARRLAQCGAAPSILAEHWLAARDLDQARRALLQAMYAARAVHAYRDAAGLGRRALEVWAEGEAESERLATLQRLGECAQLSGDLAGASRAWREVAATYAETGDLPEVASVQRQLAGIFELQGMWEPALAAREAAAAAFASSGQHGEAAAERLAAAAHLRSAASYQLALDLLAVASVEATGAGRLDLQARILGLQGDVRARMGDYAGGLQQVHAGLALALEHNLGGPAAEVYQRLADALEHAGDYATAGQTYQAAADFCQTQGALATAQLCLACMSVVLRLTGEWDRCQQICRDVLHSGEASAHASTAALGMLGSIHAQRGEAKRARPLLLQAASQARAIELAAMELLSAWGLAMVDELNAAPAAAADRCRWLLERWQRTEDRHYVVPALRWATTLFATQGAGSDARACASALAAVVAETGAAESVAALGHALGEVCLLDNDPLQAAQHFRQSIERFNSLDLPYERAHTKLRASVALLATGDRHAAVDCLLDAYRVARTLGARPLAIAAARSLADLGEPVRRPSEQRALALGDTADHGHSSGVPGLSPREREVAVLVAQGCTNREIALRLVITERTAENHLQRILHRLGLRSRTQVATWAVEHHLV